MYLLIILFTASVSTAAIRKATLPITPMCQDRGGLNDKCLKNETEIHPKCQIEFLKKFRRSVPFCAECIEPNVFLIPTQDRPGNNPPQFVKIKCMADYPMNFRYDGPGSTYLSRVLFSISVNKLSSRKVLSTLYIWKGIKYPALNSTENPTIYTIGVEVFLSSDSTGKYTIHSVLHPEILTSFFIFKSRSTPPYLIGAGENREPLNNNATGNVLIPCITSNWNITMDLFILSNASTWQDYKHPQYNPLEGFTVPAERSITVYNCTTGHLNDSLIVRIPSASVEPASNISGLRIEVTESENSARCFFSHLKSPGGINFVNQKVLNPTESQYTRECLAKGRTYCGTAHQTAIHGVFISNELVCKGAPICYHLSNIYEYGLLFCSSGNDNVFIEYFKGLDHKIYKDWRVAPSRALIRAVFTGANAAFEFHLYKFKCEAVEMILAGGRREFSVRLKNDTIVKLIDLGVYDVTDLHLPADTVNMICSDQIWTTHESVNSSVKITEYSRYIPEIIGHDTLTAFQENELAELVCETRNLAEKIRPKLEWWYQDKQITDESRLRTFESGTKLGLLFRGVSLADAGVYTCFAQNMLARVKKTFTVEVKQLHHFPLINIIIPVSLVVIIVTGISIRVFCQHKKLKMVLKDSEVKTFRYGTNNVLVSNDHDNELDISNLPYNTNYELRKRQIKIYTTQILGSGEFGCVYKGGVVSLDTLETVLVAVKTVKQENNISHVMSLLNELKVMAYLDNGHRNILNLVGACTTKIQSGEVYVCVELCKCSLLNTLHRAKKAEMLRKAEQVVDISFEAQLIDYTDMLKWAYQIADGMEFLTTKKVIPNTATNYVVHGDLAARNILISDQSEVKISDFGLGRVLENYQYIVETEKSNIPLPWKWMAIEALAEKRFSWSSDVWAFGVTLWELFSLGDHPYPDLLWSIEFIDDLKNGLRLNCPEYASEKM